MSYFLNNIDPDNINRVFLSVKIHVDSYGILSNLANQKYFQFIFVGASPFHFEMLYGK